MKVFYIKKINSLYSIFSKKTTRLLHMEKNRVDRRAQHKKLNFLDVSIFGVSNIKVLQEINWFSMQKKVFF